MTRRGVVAIATAVVMFGSPFGAHAQSTTATTAKKPVKKEISVSLHGESGPGGFGCRWGVYLEYPHVRDAVGYELHYRDSLRPKDSQSVTSGGANPGESADASAGSRRIGLTGGTYGSLAGGPPPEGGCEAVGTGRFALETSYALIGDRMCAGKPVPKGKYVIEGNVGNTQTGTGFSIIDDKPLAEKGLTIKISGPDGGTATTDDAGIYCAIVSPGKYTIAPSNGSAEYSPREYKVTINGDRSGLDFRRGAFWIQGRVFDADGRPIADASVHVVGRQGQALKTDGNGTYRERFPAGIYTLSASKTGDVDTGRKDANGQAIHETRTTHFCSSVRSSIPTTENEPCTRNPVIEVGPDRRVNFTPQDDPGILVDLEGGDFVEGQGVRVKMIVSNTRKRPLTNVTFGVPNGLVVKNASGATAPLVITQVEGPTPALPTTLEAGETVSISYRFIATELGKAVLSARVTARDAEEVGREIRGVQAANVDVTGRAITKQDVERAAKDTLEDVFDAAQAKVDQADAILDEAARQAMQLHQPSAAAVLAGKEVGIPRELSGWLEQGKETTEQFFGALGGYAEGYAEATDKFGREGGQFLEGIDAAVSDSYARGTLIEDTWNNVAELGSSGLENLGYLGKAVQASLNPTAESLDFEQKWRDEMLGNFSTAIGEATVGAPVLAQQALDKARTDPLGALHDITYASGALHANVNNEVAVGVVTEPVFAGVGAGGQLALRGLNKAGTATLSAVRAGASRLAGVAERDGASAALRRLEQTVHDSAQSLEYGTVLDGDNIVGASGITKEMGDQVNGVLRAAEEKFGGPLELTGRTAEPMSALIDGVPKEEWMKYKAVGAKDELLGAPRAQGGRVTVYDPKLPKGWRIVKEGGEEKLLIPSKDLKYLQKRNPGVDFEKDMLERYNIAKGNWENWGTKGSKVRTLVEGAKRHPDGITILESRPGNEVPHGIKYLEQLDEPEFVAKLQQKLRGQGLRQTEVEAEVSRLRKDLASHPDRYRAKPEAHVVEGGVTFTEGLSGKPIISDFDLESLRPKNGPWPSGAVRSQVELWVGNQLRRIGRVPVHGWSDAAYDLPADLFHLAIEYSMNTAHPAYGKKAAAQLSRRIKLVGDEMRGKAAKLEASAATARSNADLALTPGERQRWLQQADYRSGEAKKHLKTAESYDKYTPEYLEEKYPPGEKTIRFSSGTIDVGSGTIGQ